VALPWKEQTVELQRQSLCHRIVYQKLPVSQAAREAGVSRKTLYKFLARFKADPLSSLADQSRRPKRSSGRVPEAMEQRVLQLRDEYGWGARKLHAILRGQRCDELCSIRTITAILRRHGRIDASSASRVEASATSRFQYDFPNDLWQADHKGPIEIARRKHHCWTMMDDHSRYCLCFEPMLQKSMAFTWPMVWEAFGDFGLPRAILTDGAFADRGVGLSQWDVWLIRLGIRSIHGRPYHPQTQGKVERLHGTIGSDFLNARVPGDSMTNFIAGRDRWRNIYNMMRPHEALDDQPPMTRYVASPRKRPDAIPEMTYEPGAMLRRVSQVGDIRYHRARIVVGVGLSREPVKLVECEHDLEVYFGPRLVRVIAYDQLTGRRLNERV
jgi:transposase InsO family protein